MLAVLLTLAAAGHFQAASPSGAELAAMRAALLKQLEDLDTMAATTVHPKAPLALKEVPQEALKETLAQRRAGLATKAKNAPLAQTQLGVSSYEHGLRCGRGANRYYDMVVARPRSIRQPTPAVVGSYLHGLRCSSGALASITATASVMAGVVATKATESEFTIIAETARAAATRKVSAAPAKTAAITRQEATEAVGAAAITADFVKAVTTRKAAEAPPKKAVTRSERRQRLEELKSTRAQVQATTAAPRTTATATATTMPHAHTHHQSASHDSGMHATEMHALWEEEQAAEGLRRQGLQPPVPAPDAGSKMLAVLCFLGMAATVSAAMVYMSRTSTVRRNSFSESGLVSAMSSLSAFKPTGLMRRRRCSSVQFLGV